MKTAAIYARVSSDQQKEEKTIASQTAALVEFARQAGYQVPDEWIFEDEGYSGACLVRPGLEQVRDLAAEGQIQTVLALSPDRLSRKYAYQVMLIEELARHGVDMVFLKAPRSETPEDQLLLQFQGMIAEYERAQILERSRRGKRHRAKQGEVSVLSGAPYGYRYRRKTEEAAAYYEIIETEADVVRRVFDLYTVEGLSIGAITRRLNEQGLPTRKQRARWERSTVWAMLRNPAYRGMACFGKTALAPRQRITRPLRLRGGLATRNSASHERPRVEWIEIPVPALVSEETFALAQENLEQNKRHAPRRTIEPSVLQGLVHCRQCGYALYRTSTRSSARKIHYYRCLGSDAYRHAGQALCDQKPIRQDLLDHLVWSEILRLLTDPTLIQNELNRRLETARQSSPTQRRLEMLNRDLVRVRKSMERLLTAYQEELLSLDELRSRMPALRKREQAMQAELEALNTQVADRAAYLRLAETLTAFLERLRSNAQTLNIGERQRIMKLLVKEVIVGKDTITIKHSIPGHAGPSGDGPGSPKPPEQSNIAQSAKSYPLRPWRDQPLDVESVSAWLGCAVERSGISIRSFCG
ncbi:MAG TPA: recombinase family protein [Methylococcaceae bacterium]|nr:recombinase family protein [Methylococcaceae bacterium]